jgi:hypothetical protein
VLSVGPERSGDFHNIQNLRSNDTNLIFIPLIFTPRTTNLRTARRKIS